MEMVSFNTLMTLCMVLFLIGAGVLTTYALHMGDLLAVREVAVEAKVASAFSELCKQSCILGVISLYAVLALPMMHFGLMSTVSAVLLFLSVLFGIYKSDTLGDWLASKVEVLVTMSPEFWGHQPALFVKITLVSVSCLYLMLMALMSMPAGVLNSACILFMIALMSIQAVFVMAPVMSEKVEN